MNKQDVLDIYATKGANEAILASGISRRTIQRWAAKEGINSGFDPKSRRKGCPSVPEYMRGCRCDGCVLANKEAQREAKRRRVESYRSGERKIRKHGVSGYTNWECRCEQCRLAWSAYLRDRRVRAKRRAAEMMGDTTAADFIAHMTGRDSDVSQ